MTNYQTHLWDQFIGAPMDYVVSQFQQIHPRTQIRILRGYGVIEMVYPNTNFPDPEVIELRFDQNNRLYDHMLWPVLPC
jgi:hypothetical protein